ncbi:MAG TPA: glycosyltransferase [Thermoanaerobaculia bacterium]|jgi:glycosyltransferase involved in cell wall biosynthesis
MSALPSVELNESARKPQPQQSAIAVLMSRFPSVTETFILREMIEMERQGMPVRVVSMIKETPPVLHDAVKPWIPRALFTPFLSVQVIAANLRMFVRQPLRYLWLLTRLIAGTIARPLTLVKTLAIFPKSVAVAEQLERENVRHVHAHYASFPSTMALIIATLGRGISFSITVHAHDIQVDRSLLRWKLGEARFVRSISRFNKEFLEELYPAEARGKIHVIHVGIEPEQYAGAPPAPLGTPKLFCVAAHKPYKGLPYLIEACRILRDGGVAFHCDIVGHGPMHDELAALIRERDLDEQVVLAGPKPQEEVARMMAEAALFVLPSIVAPDGQMEGIPVALMEALASGRGVVSTTLSGIPELVEDGVSGLLVAPGDAAAFADAIRTLLGDRDRARAMGLRGREKVREEFDIRDCVRRLVALLAIENQGV